MRPHIAVQLPISPAEESTIPMRAETQAVTDQIREVVGLLRRHL